MTLLLGSACLAKAIPTLERLLPLSRTRYVFSPEPLLLPALLSLAVLVILGWSVLDAVLDRRMPPAGLAALVAFALVPWGVRRELPEEDGWLARRALAIAEEIEERLARGESADAVVAALDARRLPGPYRSRWLRAEPQRFRLLPEGVSVPQGDDFGAPGTFHVSISNDGGWVSATGWSNDGPRLARAGDGIAVFRISLPRGEGLP
ncbi:MAG: hypothetical protein DIU72_001640 [Pseudomonadota bacterium]|nr:MAG: hypothetical protein DIU72_04120 [Pseudomonadota bacterium]